MLLVVKSIPTCKVGYKTLHCDDDIILIHVGSLGADLLKGGVDVGEVWIRLPAIPVPLL